jgi:lycopene cyclase domain-containing protein
MKYTYLISILILVLPVLLDEWIIGKKKIRPYWKILFALTLLGLCFGISESLALKWAVWQFDTRRNFEIYLFGSHAETYLVNMLVFPAIGAATLLLTEAHRKVLKTRSNRNSNKRRKTKLRRVSLAAGATRR